MDLCENSVLINPVVSHSPYYYRLFSILVGVSRGHCSYGGTTRGSSHIVANEPGWHGW